MSIFYAVGEPDQYGTRGSGLQSCALRGVGLWPPRLRGAGYHRPGAPAARSSATAATSLHYSSRERSSCRFCENALHCRVLTYHVLCVSTVRSIEGQRRSLRVTRCAEEPLSICCWVSTASSSRSRRLSAGCDSNTTAIHILRGVLAARVCLPHSTRTSTGTCGR